MMVAASSLYERQMHDFDKLQEEHTELKKRMDGLYANTESRVVGGKHKAEEQLDRGHVEPEGAGVDVWTDFATQCGRY